MGQLNTYNIQENKESNRENYILENFRQNIPNKPLRISRISRIFQRMCSMQVGKSA